VFPHIPSHLPALLRTPRNFIAIGFGAATIAGITTYFLTRRKLTSAEIERARRDYLSLVGRITDGNITETQWISDPASDGPPTIPSMLLYRYSIAGVTYECAQDVSLLPDYVRHIRIDLPVQVRFDPRNPGNSIIIAESWSGLRLHIAANSIHDAPNPAP
jgi:hypothetical protein